MIRVTDLQLLVGRFALGPIDLEVGAGSYFVLLGPTGMGKTLLVECICGLARPRAGRVVLDGEDVTRLAPRDPARRGSATPSPSRSARAGCARPCDASGWRPSSTCSASARCWTAGP